MTRTTTTSRKAMQQEALPEIILTARQLLSGRFLGVLASHSQEMAGYPFGSLVPYSIDRDGWPLLLLSHLAKHTRNLQADSRCSLTIVEQGDGDMQALSRLLCLADALPVDIDHRMQARHFRYFPHSCNYYEELNFHFFRLRPVRFYCVSGFGAARWIGVDRMQATNPFSQEAELQSLELINQRLSGPLQQLFHDGSSTLAVGLDPWGMDLLAGDRLSRFNFPHGILSTDEILGKLADWLPDG